MKILIADRPGNWLAWVPVAAVLLATAVGAIHLKTDTEADAKRKFDAACGEIGLRINARLDAHAQILRSGAALFDVDFNSAVIELAIAQFFAQLKASVLVAVFSFVASWLLFKLVDHIIGLRVTTDEENLGLDLSQHRESGYTVID